MLNINKNNLYFSIIYNSKVNKNILFLIIFIALNLIIINKNNININQLLTKLKKKNYYKLIIFYLVL